VHDYDVAIVGAGAAGLIAARELADAGSSVVVLEARNRIGGRILTREDVPGAPLELGAEFIHGSAEVSFALLREAGSAAIDVTDSGVQVDPDGVHPGEDRFALVAAALERVRGYARDVSVAELARDLDAPARDALLTMVQGFDAADPARASARAIAAEWSDDVNGQTARQFRPLGGYASVLRALRDLLPPGRVRVELATPVQSLRHGSDGVVVEADAADGSTTQVHARCAIVTVPLGVLQAGRPAFDPPLPAAKRAALEGLIMGPVHKLCLRFRRPFWETLAEGRFRDASSFYMPSGGAFTVFWTLLPVRAPVLVAWAGGPRADALGARTPSDRIAAALDQLAVLARGEVDPREELEDAEAHDWQRDPYALGAYSYVAVGAEGARAALAAPVPPLFFAGEATVDANEAGTVAGALSSGRRAAREALAALRG